MTTKTASVRLEKVLFERIDNHCVTKNCTRNDFVKSAIESALDNNKDDVAEHQPHYDKYGNYWTWNNDRKIWTCHVNMESVRVTN